MLDAKLRQGASHLGRTRAVDLAAGLRREKVVAAAIGVEAEGQAMGAEHLGQPPEARGRACHL